MNVGEINTGTHGSLHTYFAIAIPFTAVTMWAIGAVQYSPASSKENEKPRDDGSDTDFLHGCKPVQHIPFWRRLWWPFALVRKLIEEGVRKSGDTSITKGG